MKPIYIFSNIQNLMAKYIIQNNKNVAKNYNAEASIN